jgi:hypothetical protein
VLISVQVFHIDLDIPATGLQWRASVVGKLQGFSARTRLEAELPVDRLPIGI